MVRCEGTRSFTKMHIWELRGRNVNVELQAPSIRPLPLGLINVQNTVQTFGYKNISLPAPIDQRPPAPVTTMSSKSSSNLDTDEDESVDKMLREVAQMFNHTPLTTIGSTLNINTGSNNGLHEKINMDKQSAQLLTKMTIKDKYYLCKRTHTMQTQVTKLGMAQ